MPNEPTDHAVARGRDVSLRYEGGHSPENHTVVLGVVLEATDRPQRQRTFSDQSSPSAEHVVVNYTPEEPEHLPPATITKGAMLSSGVGGAGEASRKM